MSSKSSKQKTKNSGLAKRRGIRSENARSKNTPVPIKHDSKKGVPVFKRKVTPKKSSNVKIRSSGSKKYRWVSDAESTLGGLKNAKNVDHRVIWLNAASFLDKSLSKLSKDSQKRIFDLINNSASLAMSFDFEDKYKYRKISFGDVLAAYRGDSHNSFFSMGMWELGFLRGKKFASKLFKEPGGDEVRALLIYIAKMYGADSKILDKKHDDTSKQDQFIYDLLSANAGSFIAFAHNNFFLPKNLDKRRREKMAIKKEKEEGASSEVRKAQESLSKYSKIFKGSSALTNINLSEDSAKYLGQFEADKIDEDLKTPLHLLVLGKSSDLKMYNKILYAKRDAERMMNGDSGDRALLMYKYAILKKKRPMVYKAFIISLYNLYQDRLSPVESIGSPEYYSHLRDALPGTIHLLSTGVDVTKGVTGYSYVSFNKEDFESSYKTAVEYFNNAFEDNSIKGKTSLEKLRNFNDKYSFGAWK